MNVQEALKMIEFQIQDDYSSAPELKDAIAVLSAVVEQEAALSTALQRLELESAALVLDFCPLLIALPVGAFSGVIRALEVARALLEKEEEDEISNDHG